MNDSSTSDPKRELLRHGLATVAYRGGKAVRNVTENFAAFQAAGAARTPVSILAHIGDLMDWGLSMANGKREWHESKPLPWIEEVERFFLSLTRFDYFLAASEPLQAPPERLLQGPIADALTHVGQIAILRRLAGEPMKGENYYKAEITAGRVGANQAQPKLEF
jgi:hypothetical protein